MTHKLAVINGLRGIAIIAVVLRHVFLFTGDPAFGVTHAGGMTFFPFAPVVNSQEAVSLFFILSGFVLALPYMTGRRTMAGTRDAVSFYARRAKRLLPLLAVVLVGSILLTSRWRGFEFFLDRLWLNAKLIVLFGVDPARPPANSPLWSLRVELWFCALMPMILIAMRRLQSEMLLLASIGLSLGTQLFAFTLDPVYRSPVMSSIAGTLSSFVIGMALARWYADGMPGRHGRFLLPISLAIILAGTMLTQHSQYYGQPMHVSFGHLATVIGLSLMVAALLATRSLLRRALESWPLQMIGLMSYSLYAWHAPLLEPLHARSGLLTDQLLFFAFLLGFGFLSYRFLEFPHVRDIRKLLPARKAPAAAPVSLLAPEAAAV